MLETPDLSDFDGAAWDPLLTDQNDLMCTSGMSIALGYRLREVDPKTSQHRALTFLRSVTDCIFTTVGREVHFSPYCQFDGKRSFLPEDLQEESRTLLEHLQRAATNPFLRARLSDLLSIRFKDHKHKRAAIDGYLEIVRIAPSHSQRTFGWDEIDRGAYLVAKLGKSAREAQERYAAALLQAYSDYAAASRWEEASHMLSVLHDRLGKHLQGETRAALAKALEVRASEVPQEGDPDQRINLLSQALKLLDPPNQFQTERAAIGKRLAYAHTRRGDMVASVPGMGHGVAAMEYATALELLREFGGTREEKDQVHRKMLEYGEGGTGEMTVNTTSIDLRPYLDEIRTGLAGLDPVASLIRLTRILPVVDIKKANLEDRGVGGLFGLVAKSIVSADGRIIAREPGDMAQDNDHDRKLRIGARNSVSLQWQIRARLVLAALADIRERDGDTDPDFAQLVTESHLVSEAFVKSVALGLSAGFRADWMNAAPFLIMRVEPTIRAILQSIGIVTSTLKQGIQEECSIDQLFDLWHTNLEIQTALSKTIATDVLLELECLLCDKAGANLRHEFAHGLLNDDGLASAPVVALWWLWLRIMVENATSRSMPT